MTAKTLKARQGATTRILVVFGGAITAATWVGGQHGLAVALGIFYLVCCVVS